MKRLRYENGDVDPVDQAILERLVDNARISVADLARAVGLSAPSVSERLKRLEEAGVIQSYEARINPAALGRPLAILLRIRPVPGELDRVAKLLFEIPDVVECDRVTGEDCYVAKAHVADVMALETLIDKLAPYAMTNTSIVQSSPVPRRLPPLSTA